MKGYLTIVEVSEKWGINTLCLEERVEDAAKPKDERIKSGKYIKSDK